MVESSPKPSGKGTVSTPEQERPRVQLELKSTTSPPVQSKMLQNQQEQQHLDLLKQTVA